MNNEQNIKSTQGMRQPIYKVILKRYMKILRNTYCYHTMPDLKTDEQGIYSVTPIDIAEYRNNNNFASLGIFTNDKHVIVDATAGIGGDTISFMVMFPYSRIHALEPDAKRVEMLNSNVLSVQHHCQKTTSQVICHHAEFHDLFGSLNTLLT